MIADAVKGAITGLLEGLSDIWARLWKRREAKTNEYLKAEVDGLKAGNRALRWKLLALKQLRKAKDGAELHPRDPKP